ncbi:O-acetyl-ADP-ribose deacetylase (regulator of RNase III) [Georgenia soli]|uniref:O-acetyl-ADP-ribose deacetylase (Regulator of RNase III) n=1 Tax=Georgenia soli TaxID=638953 RepID=A0A2A9EMF9_9MICO|nr:O-acetyl-ADP-ribose deacetylase [Georgenia soli]PFG40277.1 O-acetyl-ADP-ribose deacetylase (regulator of RNase III) [Georgenia soli]
MRIEAVRGDITREDVDAVVNAANSSLLGGGGVDGAIHRAAGPELLEECMELRRTELPDGLPVGRAVPTAGYRLRARWVIHTVGPNARRGETDPALLAACFTSSLAVAGDVGAPTVAFPAVSAGAYGWDVEEVARVAVGAVGAFAAAQENRDGFEVCGIDVRDVGATRVDLVRFVLFDDRALGAFSRELG